MKQLLPLNKLLAKQGTQKQKEVSSSRLLTKYSVVEVQKALHLVTRIRELERLRKKEKLEIAYALRIALTVNADLMQKELKETNVKQPTNNGKSKTKSKNEKTWHGHDY